MRFKLKHKIRAKSFIENLLICILLEIALERGQSYVSIWCSSYSYL